jgi:pSer/pThr/pTyr-binding forkhead associated (FHA) protein
LYHHFLHILAQPQPPQHLTGRIILIAELVLVILLIICAIVLIRLIKSKRKTRNSTKATPPTKKIGGGTAAGSKVGPQITITITVDNKQETIRTPATIGKAPGCTLRLSDQTVSDNHAHLYYDNKFGAVCIEDQGSTNGILVNNRPSRKHLVKPQEHIQIGQTTLVILALQEEVS